MACECIILDSADAEREQIIAYLNAQTGSTRAARSFLSDLNKTVESISEFPTLCAVSRLPELAEQNYRAAFVGSYVMLYLFENDKVFIVHIFHQRQDYAHLV